MSRWETACALGIAMMVSEAAFAQDAVKTDLGRVTGTTTGTVEAFKGIPFAAPPVGDLRWRAPQPAKPWEGVLKATSFSADCMQKPFPSDAAPLGTQPAEDCLYLNVWRPSDAKPDAKLPVLFWIYGGGFVNGGSSPAVYDGGKFAENGVIFVSANYRLGRFGFFAFPELTRQNPDHMLGNYGFMDQIAALKWVQRNIAAFGGDPTRVTVVGESAGGFSVSMLLTSPLTGGLFSQAIIESGGGRTGLGGQRYLNTQVPNGPSSAETAGIAFARSTGIQGDGRDALDALRKLPAERVVDGMNMASTNPVTYSGPMIDGTIVVGDPQSEYLSGAGWHVPLIIGATTMDIGFGFDRNKDALFRAYGPLRDQAIAAYDPKQTAPFQLVAYQAYGDRMMVEPARFVASVFASMGVPTYEYRFGYVAESMRKHWPGASHATDIPFEFDTVATKYGKDLSPADEKAAQAMFHYWVSFVKTGDPSTGNSPAWPRYSPAADMLMNFTENGPVFEADPWKPRLDVTERYVVSRASTPRPATSK